MILTIPFGFGIGYFYRPKWFKLCFWAALTGLFLEGIQLLVILAIGTFYHTVDINDVILNALGVILGYSLFLITQSVFSNSKIMKLLNRMRIKINSGINVKIER